MDFHHGGHDVTGDKREVHAVVPLRFAVADIGDEIVGSPSTSVIYPLAGFGNELVEVCAARMTVSVAAFHNDLRFAEFFDAPSAA